MIVFSNIVRKLTILLFSNIVRKLNRLPVYLVDDVFVSLSPFEVVISTSKLTKNTTDRYFMAKRKGVT